MSYSLVFARLEIPADDELALRWVKNKFQAHYDDERPPHSIFQRLHDALVDRFPCLSTLPEHERDDAVWVDGPLINNFSHDLAIVAFHFTRVEDVMPFVVETALKVGCTVFDLQGMNVYRPKHDSRN
ncbi:MULTISPECIES: hypothetical protein [unclassified Lentimonas]|uniref:hypothetical protein n=1 Tax=unclassified Lentimonas TaxID=2630993 RepID=UPI00132A36F4|nr:MULTISPECIES: hypothetical protein [unclassified Lentimonas]CAA6679102.1 Unannotated [Lentimonas sp. CC4]CAA6684156.1 Unannotated [Lentimonas sp. CC6]CAA7076470.1 Unannotated [Lentimonas sp. CC4]CAA7170406.1 Unannotated [Lentimonas sp. CC21]CAA7182821.1 Unannotated [Lentimonas sp. CC8]